MMTTKRTTETEANETPVSPRGEILRFFSPRWFIAIMGTGAVANILQLLSGQASGVQHTLAVTLLSIAVIAFPILLLLLLSRFWIDRAMLIKELEHSSLVQFYSAIFISAAIITTGIVKIPVSFLPQDTLLLMAKSFWGFSLVLGIALALFTPWRIITLNHGEPRRILGFWFLPPVGLFVLVFAGNFLALKTGDSSWINNLALLNALLLGTATFLSVMLFTMFLFRAFAYPFPGMDVIPSFTIGLAPVGVSIIAFVSYLPLMAKAETMAFVGVSSIAPLAKLMALLLWGFGVWWMFIVLFIGITASLRKGIPFTLGYWAFIFPPAAFTISTIILGQATQLSFVQTSGYVLGYIVFAGWLSVGALTIRGIFNLSIFNLPPSFSEILPAKESPQITHGQLKKSKMKETYPVFSMDLKKKEDRHNIDALVTLLKDKITAHPVARHISDFNHFHHTKEQNGEMPEGLLHAKNVVFCFGPKIEESRTLAMRPRSFGIAEFENHFTISFMEAPSPKATETMKNWLLQL